MISISVVDNRARNGCQVSGEMSYFEGTSQQIYPQYSWNNVNALISIISRASHLFPASQQPMYLAAR